LIRLSILDYIVFQNIYYNNRHALCSEPVPKRGLV
jgi:hypothetical protein